ncbi:myb-like DNA-binding domain containing protein [Babesia divergens]|uniref:Myb-like DNA-binding domain containing protein n=1 Tax=Babesia divergens TaxID=32595 RepID=A0AAD9G929_BABDI|nr:myb-like DNA-binding domain containing protein [Babesia divergens]
MDPNGEPLAPFGALEKLSPSISLLRRMAGITPRSHEEFIACSSQLMSNRSEQSPMGRRYFPDQSDQMERQEHTTNIMPSPGNTPMAKGLTLQTPDKRSDYYAKRSPSFPFADGNRGLAGSVSPRGPTKTPTTRQMNASLLRQCMSSCSSLRFNPASLVSLPFVYCNNTFVKMKPDDVFDPRLGRKRARSEYASATENTYARPRGSARATTAHASAAAEATEAIRAVQLQIHNEYATNPYKRRYEGSMKERRRLLRTSTMESVDESSAISPARRVRKPRAQNTKKMDEHEDDDKITLPDKAFEVNMPEKEGAVIGGMTPAYRQLPSLAEEDQSAIQHLCDVRRRVDQDLTEQMIDVLKVTTSLKKLVKASLINGTARDNLMTLCKDMETLSQMAHVVKSMIRETEEAITVLEYSKVLLSGQFATQGINGDGQINTATQAAMVEHDTDTFPYDDLCTRKSNHDVVQAQYNQEDNTLMTGKDVMIASPCIALTAGLKCVQGRCCTSAESVNDLAPTECYAAAGCYLWDAKLKLQQPQDGCLSATDSHCNTESAHDVSKASSHDQTMSGVELDGVDEMNDLGKTGPWTFDPVFSNSMLEQNRIRQFNSIKGFLKDICRIGVAELRMPSPECNTTNEYNCINEMCCPRCCTCTDGQTDPDILLHASEHNLLDENPDVMFELDAAFKKMEVHKTVLGRCLCICRCESGQNIMDRVVNEQTISDSPSNKGIVWHDIEPREQIIDPQDPTLLNESILQERFILRIKADRISLGLKKRAPYIFKLDLSCDEDEEGPEPGKRGANCWSRDFIDNCYSAIEATHTETHGETGGSYPNTIDGTDLETSNNPLMSSQECGGSQDTVSGEQYYSNIRLADFKQLTDFTFWDALDLLSKQQRELHHVMGEIDGMDCFDPLEINVENIPVERLKLDAEAFITDPLKEDYVEIAIYLPYVPSCHLPARFESISAADLLETRMNIGPKVDVQYILNAATDCNTAGDTEVVEYAGDDDTLLQESINLCIPIPNNPIALSECSTPTARHFNCLISESNSLSSYMNGSVVITNTADDSSIFASVSATPRSFRGNAVQDKHMTAEALTCVKLLRGMMVVPEDTARVLQFVQEHTLMRNHVLKKEGEACMTYKRMWHKKLRQIRKTLPKIDIFAWGVLPVRAIDMPDQFVPLPAGYKQNDINWSYANNNVLSPFEVEGYGIGDLKNKRQRFSVMRQDAQIDKQNDNTDMEQNHGTRKPAIARRRTPADVEVSDAPVEEVSRATVWLAPSYSNLMGPGIRWTYTCMDTVSEPMHCIPDFSITPIYRVMKCPEYGFYKLDHYVQYDRRNALTPQAVVEDELITCISNMWTRNECRIFIEKYLMYPKNFAKIAQFIETKRCGDCVSFYYRFKYRLKLKERLKDLAEKPKCKYEMSRFLRRDMHVMDALDSLFDDCYAEKMQEMCEQASVSFTGVNERMLKTGGIDTGRKYEIALTQHRGNWSPLEEDFQIVLENLNEGYFLPKKYRCLVSRKGVELPLSLSLGTDDTIVKRGCIVLNGNRDYDNPKQLTSLISAIKTEHVLSLKPLYCRRVAGRSILDALFHYVADKRALQEADQQDITADMGDDDISESGYAYGMYEPEQSGVENYNGERSNRNRMANWGVSDATERIYSNYSYMRDLQKLDIPLEYPTAHGVFPVRHAGYNDQGTDGLDYRMHSAYSEEQEPNEDHGDLLRYRSRGMAPTSSRSKRKRRPSNKLVGVPRPQPVEQYPPPRRGKHSTHSRNSKVANRSYGLDYSKTITEWTDAEVEEFIRLFHIYGEDWDSIASNMALYGKTKEEVIDYYVKRLTNNALRRNAQKNNANVENHEDGYHESLGDYEHYTD